MGIRVLSPCFAFVVLLLATTACGDDDTPSATPTFALSAAPTESPTPAPTPVGEPTRELAGITFYTWDSWLARRESLCASQAQEAPFLDPSVFSVPAAELPEIPIPTGYQVLDTRMCKLDGMTVINYILMSDFHIELVATDAPEWVVNVPVEQLTVRSTDVGEVVLAPTPGVNIGIGLMAVRSAPFGLIVAFGGNAPTEEVLAAVAAIDANSVTIPPSKDIFSGEISGITFRLGIGYDAFEPYTYGAHGLIGGEITPTLRDARVAIEPGYLPPGAQTLRATQYQRCGDIDAAEASYYSSSTSYGIERKSGAPEWFALYSEDWYTPTTVAGLDAVLFGAPLGIDSDFAAMLFVREAFGLTAITGPDAAELIKIAENLNR